MRLWLAVQKNQLIFSFCCMTIGTWETLLAQIVWTGCVRGVIFSSSSTFAWRRSKEFRLAYLTSLLWIPSWLKDLSWVHKIKWSLTRSESNRRWLRHWNLEKNACSCLERFWCLHGCPSLSMRWELHMKRKLSTLSILKWQCVRAR